jgi:hypothetical protein
VIAEEFTVAFTSEIIEVFGRLAAASPPHLQGVCELNPLLSATYVKTP